MWPVHNMKTIFPYYYLQHSIVFWVCNVHQLHNMKTIFPYYLQHSIVFWVWMWPVHNTTKYIPVLIRDGGSGLVLNGSRLESLYKLAPLSKKNAPIIFLSFPMEQCMSSFFPDKTTNRRVGPQYLNEIFPHRTTVVVISLTFIIFFIAIILYICTSLIAMYKPFQTHKIIHNS